MQNTTSDAGTVWPMPQTAPQMTLHDFLCVYRPAELVVAAYMPGHLTGLSAWLKAAEKVEPAHPSETRGNGERTYDRALLSWSLDRFLTSEGCPVGLDSPAYEAADPQHLFDTVNMAELGLEEAQRTGSESPEMMASRLAGITWGDERLLHAGIYRPGALRWGPRLPVKEAA